MDKVEVGELLRDKASKKEAEMALRSIDILHR